MTLPTAKELNALDMSYPVIDCPEAAYLSAFAGKEHYRLLTWLAANNHNKRITEIGCYMGLSTLCLASNPLNLVTTYDINFDAVKWIRQPGNVFKLQVFGEDSFYPGIFYSDIIFVDTWHNGIMEREVYEYLKSMSWKGILIFDDIYLNDAMSAFWKSVDLPKTDVTDIGHSTGTGIIQFI